MCVSYLFSVGFSIIFFPTVKLFGVVAYKPEYACCGLRILVCYGLQCNGTANIC